LKLKLSKCKYEITRKNGEIYEHTLTNQNV